MCCAAAARMVCASLESLSTVLPLIIVLIKIWAFKIRRNPFSVGVLPGIPKIRDSHAFFAGMGFFGVFMVFAILFRINHARRG